MTPIYLSLALSLIPVLLSAQAADRVEDICFNEISLFCEGRKGAALLGCLRKRHKVLMTPCRRLLDEAARADEQNAQNNKEWLKSKEGPELLRQIQSTALPKPGGSVQTLPGKAGNAPPETRFAAIRDAIEGFIRLKLTDKGGLALDREFWEISKSTSTETRFSEIKRDLKTRFPGMNEKFLSDRAMDALNNENRDSNPVIIAFNRFQQKVFTGGAYGAGDSDGPNSRSWFFQSHDIFCRLTLKKPDGISIRITDLSESLAPGTISLIENGNGGFSVFIFPGGKGSFLTMRQKAENEFSLDFIQNGVMTKITAKNFEALLAKDNKYLEGQIFPFLTHIGIRPPSMPAKAKGS